MEDTKRPGPGGSSDAGAPGDGAAATGATVTGAAVTGATVAAPSQDVATLPPTMPPPPPPAAPPAAAGATLAAPAQNIAALPPTMPATSFPRMPGTVQMPFGAAPGTAAAPIMATLAGPSLPGAGPPPMPPPDRYELGREIARGGMGRVVEATDTMLGRVVALKEVLAMDDDVLRRFARETRITARLEHPSIVPLHDAGTTPGGAPYYVMRKISGRPLEQLVAAAETLNKRLVLVPHIVASAQAIAHAHERGIVHRDIKPSNILVGELGETIVIDWGLAKVIGEADEPSRADLSASIFAVAPLATGAVASAKTGGTEPLDTDAIKTRAGIVFGTPGFMAPEQLRGHPVTERCDVYALGATLYHMLSRRPPHHAKTADEMMRQAAHHPPIPITELVPGVPAELATIVEKSLAHDPEQRYADARALAEDLQRFLSGQLVASHHYSPRERLARFARKHRVPVLISAAAALALLVVGVIAVSRVTDERDRANEHARIAEDERDWLTLTQARSAVESNPTLALAMVRPLAERYWPEVRSIAAAARAHGVAYGLPASKQTLSLQMSSDGTRALTAGGDGVVRIYDLPKRTWRAIPAATAGPPRVRFADEERRVVAWRDRTVAVVDALSGAARSVTARARIVDLETAGATAYWIDDQQTLWLLDLAAGTAAPAEVPLPEPVTQVAPSPDGRFLALFGRDHLLLLDRKQPGAEPIEIKLGVTKAFDWSADGTEFGALVDREAILGSVEAPHIKQRNQVNERFYVAHSSDRVYVLGPTGVGTIARAEDASPRKQINGVPVGLREARGGVVVAGSSSHLVVLSAFGDRSIDVPTGKLELLDAHPRSPYVVGAIEDQLLVWNLDDIEPRRVASGPRGERRERAPLLLLGASHAIAAFGDAGPQWIDLASGKAEPLGEWPLRTAVASPSGQLACAIGADRRARLLAPGRPPVPIDGPVDVAGFATDTALLLGTGDAGTVQLYDPRDGKRTPLFASPGKLLDLAWNRAQPAWAAALFGGGTLWRQNLATGREATLPNAGTSANLQVLRDGTVMFADGRAIRAWRPGGAATLHAELPRRAVAIGLAGPGHLLAVLDDDSAWLVDLAEPNRVAATESVGSSARGADAKDQGPVSLSMAADTGTLVVPNNGGVNVVDAVERQTWTLAVQPSPDNLYERSTVAYSDPRISADGTRVIARLNSASTDTDALVTWSITVPRSGAETAKWVDSLTNAALATRRSHKLIWR